jgi:hypothetical protein
MVTPDIDRILGDEYEHVKAPISSTRWKLPARWRRSRCSPSKLSSYISPVSPASCCSLDYGIRESRPAIWQYGLAEKRQVSRFAVNASYCRTDPHRDGLV